MAIVIENRGRLDMPIIVCDTCDEEITGQGIVSFGGFASRNDIYVAHKGADSPGCQADRDIYPLSIEMDAFLEMLVNNFKQAGKGGK